MAEHFYQLSWNNLQHGKHLHWVLVYLPQNQENVSNLVLVWSFVAAPL